MRFFKIKGLCVCLVIIISFFFLSCEMETEKPVQFAYYSPGSALFGLTRAAQEGIINFSNPQKLEYRHGEEFIPPPLSSFQIEYEFSRELSSDIQNSFSLVLDTGDFSWQLPMESDIIYLFSVPASSSFDGSFSIELVSTEKIDKDLAPVFYIRRVGFVERFFGFSDLGSVSGKQKAAITPFVSRQESGFLIDVPDVFWPALSYAGVSANFSGPQAALDFLGQRYETFPGARNLYIPPSFLASRGRAAFFAEDTSSFILNIHKAPPAFPQPVRADPLLVIEWPQELWRNRDYEVFVWDRLNDNSNEPPILIFDYADYGVQDRMLKRLAFFVEKAGFTGRLAPDNEIAHLHGWNAHDYRAEDLARFFDLARRENFPLLDEELELEAILLEQGIIRENAGGIIAGEGAVISIARESPEYLRYRFMVHEGFHGLFFIDEEFREFCAGRWEIFPADAKRFLLSYFGYQGYDTNDEYLTVNEFMAHILQQTVSQAADYFGRQLPLRLEPTWRASSLPPKNAATGTWPALASAFTAEAQALSDYANRRWGLAAGRVWLLQIK